jgi:hypothetical protein
MKANRWLLVAALVLTMGMSASAFAQAQGGQGGGGNRGQNGGRQRGNFDPAQMRERYMNQIKEQLASPDDEWKLIQPRLEKVLNAQRETRSSRFGSFGNRGGRNRGGNTADNRNNQPQSPVAQASEDLRKALDDKSTPPEEITKKIAALHEAREKAKTDLAAAQKDLRELLSVRQEATLIASGILD